MLKTKPIDCKVSIIPIGEFITWKEVYNTNIPNNNYTLPSNLSYSY